MTGDLTMRDGFDRPLPALKAGNPVLSLIDDISRPTPAQEWLMSDHVAETLRRFREEDARTDEPWGNGRVRLSDAEWDYASAIGAV